MSRVAVLGSALSSLGWAKPLSLPPSSLVLTCMLRQVSPTWILCILLHLMILSISLPVSCSL